MTHNNTTLSAGAIWQRWEPHIHGPGTVLNDQFKGSDSFENYIRALEQASPIMKAISVTDYYSTEVYEAVIEEKKKGRLTECDLIFPNIEMRLNTATIKGAWVNVHLLVCPDDPNHLTELHRFLNRLSFEAFGDKFSCTKDDLIRLGKKVDSRITEDHKALEIGSVQFKVSREQLLEEFRASDWAKANILIAVAGGSDGSSGVRDAADTTLREEIEKVADIIFASSDRQRDFWLGKKALNAEQIIERYRCLKPCLHGSDAHRHEDVGAPAGDRYTWIKGVATFDCLRQACIDPEGRVFIGANPPLGAMPSQVIQSIEIQNTEWCETPKIPLNPGLVAIIGARGSGKTALAEIIAAGCDATNKLEKDKSFLVRAESELTGSTVVLNWGGDRPPVTRALDNENLSADKYETARYLSQQFVDDLCSSDGITDKLLKEVERIVFNSHDVNQREGTTDFQSLLNLKASRARSARTREESGLQILCDRIGSENEKIALIAETLKLIEKKSQIIKQHETDRAKFIVKGSEERIERLDQLSKAADTVRGYVRYFTEQEQSLLTIQDEIQNLRQTKAPEELRSMQERNLSARLKPEDWNPFLTDFKGDVDSVVNRNLVSAKKSVKGWKGSVPENIDPNLPLIADDQDLNNCSLGLLDAEIKRLSALIGADKDSSARYTRLTQVITQEQDLIDGLKKQLEDYEGARSRIQTLRTERDSSYGRIFDALLEEESILRDLYNPIMIKLEGSTGTLKKMSFSVKRTADVKKWAEEGETLFDLREIGPFKGKGSLEKIATELLQPAWEKGNSEAVLEAMKVFRERTQEDLLAMSKVAKSDKVNFRNWAMQFAKLDIPEHADPPFRLMLTPYSGPVDGQRD